MCDDESIQVNDIEDNGDDDVTDDDAISITLEIKMKEIHRMI